MAQRMTKIDPAKNMARFYEIDIQPGLFGDFSVLRHWGRIGTNGQSLEGWFSDEDAAATIAERIARQKTGRGYKPAI
mgnify:CR=1 FL=1